MHMSDEFNAKVEAELQAQIDVELQAEMARKRAAIAARLRREAEMKEYDRINARHPIEGPLAGLTPEQHAARLKEMDRRAAADFAAMDEAEARGRARVAAEAAARPRRASIGPGAEGFEIRPVGRS
jgi:hypothetical protein